MPVAIIFLFGIGNFAMHQAVLHSGHPLLGQVPWFVHLLGGRVSLIGEFLVLLAAMLLVAYGTGVALYAYLGYSVANAVSAWLIITRRV